MSSGILEIDFTCLPKVNYAMQQNKIPLIRQFTIRNISGNPLSNIKILLNIQPEFAISTPYLIETIPPGDSIRIDDFKLNLLVNFFMQITEQMAGNLNLEISVDDSIIYQDNYPVEILAFNEWGGSEVFPEMLSAFIIPNHPILQPVLQKASEILEQWTGNPAWDEYQTYNSDRVKKQMAAIYVAITELNINYSTIPPSFEKTGQRIRLADTVLGQKTGTCLDMSLLYASCLEAVGINPLLILINGHAFAGGWLIPETFPDMLTDDLSFVTKRFSEGINEILLVETTCMNKGNSFSFDDAVLSAGKKLSPPYIFEFALDVKRSRFSGIRPLPQRIFQKESQEISEAPLEPESLPESPVPIQPYDLSSFINPGIPVTKQLLWERKLLDLSLRNNLLNTRITANTLRLISSDLDKLEDALSDGDEFQILPKPADWNHPLFTNNSLHNPEPSFSIMEFIRSELSQKRLRAHLNETELNRSLLNLYRSSRLSLEENGANTLYLALGFLKWYETPNSERARYAPILLLPVEIIRKSAAKGYIIRTREDEVNMNITLLEMLRQNFGLIIPSLNPLPSDEKGIDVKLVYSLIRKAIMEQRKWEVEEQAVLGIFSFNKFIMWNDIHSNSRKLEENKIVSSLIQGKLEWKATESTTNASILDKTLKPSDLILPISADSSQLEAIYDAVNDQSFILHGPPGTGKSQTITNIIANAIYKGKRVLFVAEKMAALSVVQKRLENLGLDPFCLELHSNKIKKSEVISQLKKSTEVVRYSSPEKFKSEAEKLLKLKSELQLYVDSLHRKHSFGLSLYEAISSYLSIEETKEIKIPLPLIESANEQTLTDWKEAVESLANTGKAFGHPHQHPLTGIRISSYSANIREEFTLFLNRLLEATDKLQEQFPAVKKIFGDIITNLNHRQVKNLISLLHILSEIPELTPDLLTLPLLSEKISEFQRLSVHGKQREQARHSILTDFSAEIFTLQAATLYQNWKKYDQQWFLPRYFGQRKIKKQLQIHSLSGKINTEQTHVIFPLLIQFQEKDAEVKKYSFQLSSLFGKFGKTEEEDWSNIERILQHTLELNHLLPEIIQDISGISSFKQILATRLSEGIETFRQLYQSNISGFISLHTELEQVQQLFTERFLSPSASLYSPDSGKWLQEIKSQAEIWLSHADKLKNWYQWLMVVNRLEQLHIGFIASEYKENNLPTHSIYSLFSKGLYHGLITFILSKEPNLELFEGKLFNEIIQKYKTLNSDFVKISQRELYATLASRIPSFTQEASQNSEVGILQKNLRNNARGTSIRKLFDSIPTLLSRMCPCMLMSPISVAQYIDAESEKFDLVIFDEASQMPTSEAVGAIARGKNVIVVGDPKQLPPTSFFSVNSFDEENPDLEDLESILDDCLALSIPSKHLLWHYRSKHESLISFSNSQYYENKLFTFPSPDNIESKVKLIPIDGFYDKSRSRQNRAEAQAVVNEIVRRLSDEKLRRKSIGVVTFSSAQQTLIEDLLSDLFIFHPELETWATECPEPVFIKNLENVQGDERDIILFSIGYGPDKDGKISMNFGPLNRTGGERRLNVAISRARYEMMIFSVLKAEQIDLNRTSSLGVEGLKRFLEFAETGRRISTEKKTILPNSSVESNIAHALRNSGYEVHTHIGSSGFTIDLGIVDRLYPSQYILGIVCDGINYRDTKTVKDREIIQPDVLKMLGWNLYRVWTLDWWEHPDHVLQKLLEILKKLEQNDLPESGIQLISNKNEYFPIVDEPDKNTVSEIIPETFSDSALNYEFAQFSVQKLSSEQFYLTSHKKTLTSQIQTIVNTEAPISRSLLYKRIIALWGITRMGPKITEYLDSILTELDFFSTSGENSPEFLWKNEEQYNTYLCYRINSNREVTDIPPEEVANAVKQLINNLISLPVKDLIRLSAQIFGFSRAGNQVELSMQQGIKEAESSGFIRIDGDRAFIK